MGTDKAALRRGGLTLARRTTDDLADQGLAPVGRILGNDAVATVCCERTQSAPFGIAGGGSGAPARIVVTDPDGSERELNSKGSFRASADSVVTFEVPGSGGFGPALDRDPEQLRADLLNGYVSSEGAIRDYGVQETFCRSCLDGDQASELKNGRL